MNVVVSTHTIAIDAHIVRGRLEAEGIPAFIQDDQYITMDWTLSLALGGVKVRVPSEYKEAALQVLQNTEDDTYQLSQMGDAPVNNDQGETYLPEETLYCPACNSDKISQLDLLRRFSLTLLFVIGSPLAFSKRFYVCDDCDHVFAPDSSDYSLFTRVTVALASILLAMLTVFTFVANDFQKPSIGFGDSDFIMMMDDGSE